MGFLEIELLGMPVGGWLPIFIAVFFGVRGMVVYFRPLECTPETCKKIARSHRKGQEEPYFVYITDEKGELVELQTLLLNPLAQEFGADGMLADSRNWKKWPRHQGCFTHREYVEITLIV